MTETRIISAEDPAGIVEAAALLKSGGLVAFPTETVYGLGADATNPQAVARIFEAKGRPSFNPLIVHLPDVDSAHRIANLPEQAVNLAKAFWPGALTLVCPKRQDAGVADLVTAGLGTIAIRVPAHPVARALLRQAGIPVAAPSANPSGRVSPTSAAHVADGLSGKLDMILDSGACDVGLESTIIGFTGIGFAGDQPVLLRAGGIAREEIEHHVGPLLDPAADAGITAPGQLARHYAPQTPLRLNATHVEPGEALIAFGPDGPEGAIEILNLSAVGNLREAAANLFAVLHQIDNLDVRSIAVMPIPNEGLGEAINDRLKRAAHEGDGEL